MASVMILSGGGALPMASLSFANSSRLSFSRSETLAVPLSSSAITASTSSATSTQTLPSVYCGRGDKKTAKGKRFNHSFGNARPRSKDKGRGPPRSPVTPLPPRKDKFEDGDVIKIDIDESLFTS
ncbi:hypothetical protein GIB67_027418 [Kingdonia uniflora]|uniref:30S ribosomal protein S31, chloroplastic n=1 Tax=Kingdonia uniflora TaxID=39325 RepID=A0A7J7MFA0_9MAGN|nr:hypothetical protein GIB67_027418 [Kingdonia uniflora]